MKVSELAKRTGVATSAIRFYEAQGVLPQAARTTSGYREYDEADLCRVRVLVSLRSLGLDLHEAGRLATLCSDGRCDEMATDLLPRIVARRDEIAAARAELDHLDAELGNLERTLRAGNMQLNLCPEGSDAHDSGDQGNSCVHADCCEAPVLRL